MASFAQAERSALHGLALPGRHGASAGAAGLLIEERIGLELRQRHRQARQARHAGLGGRDRVRRGVAERSAPRHPGQCHLRRHRTGSVDRKRRRAGSAELRRTGARADRPVRRGVGSVRRAAGAAALAARACATCWPRACRSTCTRKCSSRATSPPRWSPMSACRSTCSTMRVSSSPRRAAWRGASGHGSRPRRPSSAMTS